MIQYFCFQHRDSRGVCLQVCFYGGPSLVLQNVLLLSALCRISHSVSCVYYIRRGTSQCVPLGCMGSVRPSHVRLSSVWASHVWLSSVGPQTFGSAVWWPSYKFRWHGVSRRILHPVSPAMRRPPSNLRSLQAWRLEVPWLEGTHHCILDTI